jgi:hypothetical protein
MSISELYGIAPWYDYFTIMFNYVGPIMIFLIVGAILLIKNK